MTKYFLLIFISLSLFCEANNWRSILYPKNWKPGYSIGQGLSLPDFSYAGYHSGLKKVPVKSRLSVNVVSAPYYIDNTGNSDVTIKLQEIIDAVGKAGGGVVYLPAGTYKISLGKNANSALRFKYNNVILKGDGINKTFIKCTSTFMQKSQVIYVCPDNGDWNSIKGKSELLSLDAKTGGNVINLKSVSDFKKNDIVLLTCKVTNDFTKEHLSENEWKDISGPKFLRKIIRVDYANTRLMLDAPIRYDLKVRDVAKVYKVGEQISECGIEDLSVGNIENTALGWDNVDFTKPETGAYAVHSSHFFVFKNAINCWMRNVSSYRPVENKNNVHVLSNCLTIRQSRFITIQNCDFRNPQYLGEGGNGYLFTLEGNDCLLKSCYGEAGRHNYDFKGMAANGNVVLYCKSKNSKLGNDFHMHLSMSNLIDNFECDGDFWEATFRPYGDKGGMHMYSTTQSVFWNTRGASKSNKPLIVSKQFGIGYVIGTSGLVSNVSTQPIRGNYNKGFEYDTSPEDFTEGIGKGEFLIPVSLYLDQLEKRKKQRK